MHAEDGGEESELRCNFLREASKSHLTPLGVGGKGQPAKYFVLDGGGGSMPSC